MKPVVFKISKITLNILTWLKDPLSPVENTFLKDLILSAIRKGRLCTFLLENKKNNGLFQIVIPDTKKIKGSRHLKPSCARLVAISLDMKKEKNQEVCINISDYRATSRENVRKHTILD